MADTHGSYQYRRVNFHHKNKFLSDNEKMPLRKSSVLYRKNSAGLLVVYNEIRVNFFDQVLILSFL